MENTISRTQFNVIQTAFAKRFNKWENEDIHFQVCTVDSVFDDKVEFGINWAAIGTVSPEKTIRFAEELIIASMYVDKVNSLNLVIDYKKEDNIETKEQFYAEVDRFIAEYFD